MHFSTQQKRELLSFDSELTDNDGNKIPIDCQIHLPSIWGEKVEILMGIPHSKRHVIRFNNPCNIDTTCGFTGKRFLMNKIWYREIITPVFPARNLGTSPISITHIADLCISENYHSTESQIVVYISRSDFFDSAVPKKESKQEFIEELFDFSCPNLGQIQIQRYWVKASVSDKNRYLLSSGYLISIPNDGNCFSIECVLNNLKPILDILSILLRQRIVIHGWECFNDNIRKRFWFKPIEPIETKYVGVEPTCYLVSPAGFENQVNTALANYAKLVQRERDLICSLSYSLSPAIVLKTAERFLSLFQGLEQQAKSFSGNNTLTSDDEFLIKKLNDVAESFSINESKLKKRVVGIIRKIRKNSFSLKDKLNVLLKDINRSTLWGIDGETGFIEIRNELAHKGSLAVNPQGLAVATWHLAVLTEGLICQILGLTLENSITAQINGDEWAQPTYWKELEKSIFKV